MLYFAITIANICFKKPEKVEKLVLAMALQIGCEVSYNELGQMVGADNETVEKSLASHRDAGV